MRKLIALLLVVLLGSGLAFSQTDDEIRYMKKKKAAHVSGSPSWSLVQHVMGDATNQSGTCGGSGATCQVTASIGSGHYLAIHAITNNAVTLSTISAGGTLTLCASSGCSVNDGENAIDAAYVLTSTSTSGPVTLTFSGNHGHAVIDLREYACTNGTISFDTYGSTAYGAGAPTVSGMSPTLGGTNDVITQEEADHDVDVVSVASPWGNLDISPADGSGTGGAGFADNLNTSSNAAPIWTMDGTSEGGVQNVLAAKCQ